ncbi:MAG: ABC transporter ATP-binding protein [Fretibacterium sp.]|nr:ABC transporter ATP-binding protein [Fretibacterium sp.]
MREFSWDWFFPRPRAKKKAAEEAAEVCFDNVLELQDVCLRFGGLSAVDKLSMAIREGEIVGLIGPNGAGKTSVFNVISGFYKPTSGEVRFLGRPLSGLSPETVCRAGISRTFQNIRLFGTETVLQNVMVAQWVRQRTPWWMTLLPFLFSDVVREDSAARTRAMMLLEQLGLDGLAEEKASSLPYGAQRRLEIARALATGPKLLLLDEPAAGMNPQESAELMQFIRRLRDEFHLTILLIEHDMKVVMNVCDTIHVLDQGIHIAQGTPDEVRANPQVIEAYLGAGAKEGV